MSVLKSLSLVLAFTAAISLVLGGFGFTSVSADRGVHLEVVEDDRAIIGFDAHQVNPNKATIKITNRYIEDLEVTVEAETSVTKTIAVGKEKSFSVRVECEPSSTNDQDVTVSARLLGTSEDFATIERTIEIPPCSSDGGDGDGDSLEETSDDGTDSDGGDDTDDA